MFALLNIGSTGRLRARTQSSASDMKPMGTTLSVTGDLVPLMR
jgi:hypothetical protein